MRACALQGSSASRQLVFCGEGDDGIAAGHGCVRRCAGCVFTRGVDTPVAVEWEDRRRQISRSSPFLASPRSENTVFPHHGWAMVQKIEEKRCLWGLILVKPLAFAIGAPDRTVF